MTSQKPIELVLFFTRGVSLQTWDEAGILTREVALYHKLQEKNVVISFVTYAGNDENRYANQARGIRILSNYRNLPPFWYRKKLELFPPRGTVFKSNQVDGAQIALVAARRARAGFVARCGYLLSQVQENTHGKDSLATQSARNLEKEVFTAADRISVTTQAMSEVIQDEYQIPFSKISIVPNYVEVDRFQPFSRETNKKPRVGFVGRLAWEKNLRPLIEAVSNLDAELVLVGEGPQKEELIAHAAEKKADVIFFGRVSNADLPKILNSWDVFVLPSLYEGHPKALLEAMACGLPVVGTRVTGIRELIVDGENGLLCEPDAPSIRQTIERVLGDSALRTRLGKNARRYVEQHFALERAVDLEMAVLNALVN